MVLSSAAALTIILTLTILFLTTLHHKYRSGPEMTHPVLQKHLTILILESLCEIVEPGSDPCRRPRSGSQDELLLLGLLLSSSSILVSGLDGASLSSWTSELLCSVSSHVQGRALMWVSRSQSLNCIKRQLILGRHRLKPQALSSPACSCPQVLKSLQD